MYYPCTAGGRAVFRLLRIDFSHFLQVMKVRGSELGDGPLAEDGKVVWWAPKCHQKSTFFMGMRGFQVGCNWDYEALLASSMARHPIIAPLPQVLEFGTVVAQRCLNFSFLKT